MVNFESFWSVFGFEFLGGTGQFGGFLWCPIELTSIKLFDELSFFASLRGGGALILAQVCIFAPIVVVDSPKCAI